MKSRSTCPSCKSVLEFDRAAISVVKCPKCSYKGNVADFKQVEKKVESSETEFAASLPTNKLYRPGKLELQKSDVPWLQDERIVNLQRGINTIGRTSCNSTSNIQLPTTDPYMSKAHTIIDVIMKNDGVFEHRLSDKESKNGTFHNGDRLESGDVIKLVPGDIIKIGHTLFKFIAE